MAQVSYGTITINDITDITDVFLQYGLAISSASVPNAYAFDNTGEKGWYQLTSDTVVDSNKIYYQRNNDIYLVVLEPTGNPSTQGWYESSPYPTWTLGYQIWVRQVTIKEGIVEPEYGTPYLDTAVNQINTSVINIDNRLKTFFYPGDVTRNFSGAFVTGKTEAEGLVETNSNTYGFNTRVATGLISMGYNRLPLLEMGLLGNDFNGIKLYSPVVENSQIINTIKGLELSDNGLNFYNTNGVVTSSFGNSISLASNGAAITIGSTSSYNTYIDSQGLSLRNGITENAKLDSNGLVLSKGGIIAGSGNNFIYLSTEGYPLYGEVIDGTTSDGLTINNHTPSTATSGNDDPAWRQIIGTKFGVDSEGNLYASDVTITGHIEATSGYLSSGVRIGNASGPHISIEDEMIVFWKGEEKDSQEQIIETNKSAYITGEYMYIPYTVVLNEMVVGERQPVVSSDEPVRLWSWRKMRNENLRLIWMGGED